MMVLTLMQMVDEAGAPWGEVDLAFENVTVNSADITFSSDVDIYDSNSQLMV